MKRARTERQEGAEQSDEGSYAKLHASEEEEGDGDRVEEEEEEGSSGSPHCPEPWPSSSVEAALDWYEPSERASILFRGLEALPTKELRDRQLVLQRLAHAAAACPWSPGSGGVVGDSGGPEAEGDNSDLRADASQSSS